MKKNPLVPILGGGVIAALVLGVMAVIVLVDAGLLHLLGVRCDSFGWLVLYVLVAWRPWRLPSMRRQLLSKTSMNPI